MFFPSKASGAIVPSASAVSVFHQDIEAIAHLTPKVEGFSSVLPGGSSWRVEFLGGSSTPKKFGHGFVAKQLRMT